MLIHLHVGSDKAGSSAIQTSMMLNVEWFYQHALFIPKTGLTITGHWKLFRDLSPVVFDELRDELDVAAARGFEHAFLSWEGINTFSRKKIETIKHRLKDHEVRIYAYLREQSEIIQSGYFQQVKTQRSRYRLADFHKNRKMLCPEIRNYAAMLNRFAAVFGEEAVTARVFDRSLLKGNNVVVDMLDLLHLEPDAGFELSPGDDNPSLDAAGVAVMNLLDAKADRERWPPGGQSPRNLWAELVDRTRSLVSRFAQGPFHASATRVLNLYYGDTPEGRKDIVDVLLNIVELEGGVGKYFLTEADCDIIRGFYAESNKEVVDRFFGKDWPHPELFPYTKKRIRDVSNDAVERAVSSRLETVARTGSHRTWNGLPLEGEQLQTVARAEDGWSSSGSSANPIAGHSSTIRFRVDWKHVNFTHRKLLMVVIGVPSSIYVNSNITVNGHDLGKHHLKRARIEIPLSMLQPLGLVDVQMQHLYAETGDSSAVSTEPEAACFELVVLHYSRKS